MTTKDQERKALDKIVKIVAELGEDSYIGKAMEGVLDIAISNIELDFWDSMKDRAECAKAETEKVRKTAEQEIARLTKELKDRERDLQELQEDCNELNIRIEKLREDKFKAEKEAIDARKDVTIKTAEGEKVQPFAEIRYIDNNGFRFINVIEKSGWVTSYKMDALQGMTIA